MGFWARLRGLFGRDAPKSAGGLLQGVFPAGQAPKRGTAELLRAYKEVPFVRAVVSRIANEVASVPLELYRAKRGRAGVARQVAALGGKVRKSQVAGALRAGDLQEVESHPFLDLLTRFNPALPGFASRQVTQLYMELKGEAFWVHELNGLGQPLELWPVPPHWVAQTPSETTPYFRAAYSGWHRLFPEEVVTWLREPDPENPYGRGAGTGDALSRELDISEYHTRHLANWFFNNAIPPAIISLPELGEAETSRFRERLRAEHRGVDKAHQPFVTNAPDIKVEQLSNTFREQQVPELREWSRNIMLQTFGMPPELLGIIENSNRATIDAAEFLFQRGVVCPRLDWLCSVLQPLADAFEDGLVLDYVSPVPEDKEFQKSVMVAVPTVFTIDEHRALAGKGPLEDDSGGVLFQPPGGGFGLSPEEMSSEPAWAKSLPRPRRKELTMREVEQALEKLRPERLEGEAVPVWEERLRRWGQRSLAEVGAAGSFNMRNPLVREHLEKFGGDRIRGVTDTTRAELRKTLIEGVYQGEGIRDLQKRVTEVFDFADKVRARRIARTEVVGSSNFASVEAFKQSNVVAGKEWLAVRDANTRDEHRQLDGSRVSLDSAFEVNGHRGHYPGGFGVAELDINCRCAALPVVQDAKTFAPEALVTREGATEEEKAALWKRYDRRLVPWEKAAASAFRRGFRKQEQDVLDALERVL